jgi:uncharacterized membrane protein
MYVNMSNPLNKGEQKPTRITSHSRNILPRTKVGWWAVGLAVIGIAAWFILPIITVNFRERYPVTDMWVMPAIGTVLIDVSAVFNLLCIWSWRNRSVVNIVFAVLTILMALIFTLIVVGETLSGA